MTRGGTRSAIVGLTVRRTWKGAAAVGASVVLVTVTAVGGYVAAYPDPADRVVLAESIGLNAGMTALFGEARRLDTVAGFTEWRVLLILALVGGIWALFATTRVLRGEEDAGRAEVVLAGPVTRTGAVGATLAGIAVVLGLLLAVAVLGLVLGAAAELGAGRAALLGATLASTPAVMAGTGAVASQLADSRRRAAGLGGAVLGLCYVLRVVADSSPDLRWLRWATPLGWLELAAPLTEPDPWPVAITFGTAVVLGLLALALVRRRDLGAGVLHGRDSRRPRTRLLGSPLGLATRLGAAPAASWAAGLWAFGMLIGLVARTASDAMAESTGAQVLEQLGIGDTGTRAYVGVSFVFVTVTLAIVAAGQVAATRDEEASTRLDALLVGPVGRARWLGGRLTVATGTLLAAAATVVLGAWLGGEVGDLGVAGSDLARAGANAFPAAVFVLGAGTLLHGLAPRVAVPITYILVAASFLLEIVGSAVELPPWLLNLSVFHHVAPVPAAEPDWPAALVLVTVGAALAAVGVLAFGRRDLEVA